MTFLTVRNAWIWKRIRLYVCCFCDMIRKKKVVQILILAESNVMRYLEGIRFGPDFQ